MMVGPKINWSHVERGHGKPNSENPNSEYQIVACLIRDHILFIKKIYRANYKSTHHRLGDFALRNSTHHISNM